MPSSKGYRPTAFHVTYARQEQRSSKSPLLIRPAGLTTLFHLHFFPVPLSKNCRALSQESTREVLPCTKCLSLQACYPLSAKRWKSMTSIVCYWYGYDMEHSPTSSRKPFPLPLRRLRREPTSKALETEEVPITLKCSQCGHTFPAVKGEHFFAPCPACGEQYGHSMETGRELYVQHIEAE